MTLFEFYEDQTADSKVIDMRAEIIGFRIVWKLRHNYKYLTAREKRDEVKAYIAVLKEYKDTQKSIYESAKALADDTTE